MADQALIQKAQQRLQELRSKSNASTVDTNKQQLLEQAKLRLQELRQQNNTANVSEQQPVEEPFSPKQFVKDIGLSVIKTGARLGASFTAPVDILRKTLPSLLPGGETPRQGLQRAVAEVTQPKNINIPYLGTVKNVVPYGINPNTGEAFKSTNVSSIPIIKNIPIPGKELFKDVIGSGAELASYAAPVKGAVSMAKGLMTGGLKGLIKPTIGAIGLGGVGGGLMGGGTALQEQRPLLGKNLGENLIGQENVLGRTISGIGIGAIVNPILGGVGASSTKIASKLPFIGGVIKKKFQTETEKELNNAVRTFISPPKGVIQKYEIRQGKNIDDIVKTITPELNEKGLILKTPNEGWDTAPLVEKMKNSLSEIAKRTEKFIKSKPNRKIDLNNILVKTNKYIDSLPIMQEEKNELMELAANRITPEITARKNIITEQLLKGKEDIDLMNISALQKKIMKRDLDNELKRLVPNELSGMEAQRMKQGAWNVGYDQLKPNKSKVARYVGHQLKKAIEETYKDVAEIGRLNELEAQYIDAIAMVINAHGNPIKGNTFQKRAWQIIGAMAGSHFGPTGTLAGAAIGERMASRAINPEIIVNKLSKKVSKSGMLSKLEIAKRSGLLSEKKNLKPPTDLYGGIAGVEVKKDEEGKLKMSYSPEKGLLGVGLMAGVSKGRGLLAKEGKLAESKLAQEARKYKNAEELFLKGNKNEKASFIKEVFEANGLSVDKIIRAKLDDGFYVYHQGGMERGIPYRKLVKQEGNELTYEVGKKKGNSDFVADDSPFMLEMTVMEAKNRLGLKNKSNISLEDVWNKPQISPKLPISSELSIPKLQPYKETGTLTTKLLKKLEGSNQWRRSDYYH